MSGRRDLPLTLCYFLRDGSVSGDRGALTAPGRWATVGRRLEILLIRRPHTRGVSRAGRCKVKVRVTECREIPQSTVYLVRSDRPTTSSSHSLQRWPSRRSRVVTPSPPPRPPHRGPASPAWPWPPRSGWSTASPIPATVPATPGSAPCARPSTTRAAPGSASPRVSRARSRWPLPAPAVARSSSATVSRSPARAAGSSSGATPPIRRFVCSASSRAPAPRSRT